ncbi:MAG: hypothetical protein ACRCX2_14055 [Paraclostridium sp.]
MIKLYYCEKREDKILTTNKKAMQIVDRLIENNIEYGVAEKQLLYFLETKGCSGISCMDCIFSPLSYCKYNAGGYIYSEFDIEEDLFIRTLNIYKEILKNTIKFQF